ncbi:hypothetical protein [Synechocystis sp. LKSZ1]|uniref:hypothetical protein n=1 Tax=Synechocystis sp. LKSZ1 TaxID=3144951 RepID=UPI00336BD5E8
MVTKHQIQEVLEKYPSLNYFGFGIPIKPSRYREAIKSGEFARELKEKQEDLFKNIGQIERVIDWLKDVEKIKTFNRNHSSYGLKHWVEDTPPRCYIANGSFIVGAVLAGFDVKVAEFGSPNAYFNMSEKSLKALKDGNGKKVKQLR